MTLETITTDPRLSPRVRPHPFPYPYPSPSPKSRSSSAITNHFKSISFEAYSEPRHVIGNGNGDGDERAAT
jgi:hypothetical protein